MIAARLYIYFPYGEISKKPSGGPSSKSFLIMTSKLKDFKEFLKLSSQKMK